MKNILLYIFCLSVTFIYAQQTPEFSFKLYFEDAVGNKDTLTIGHSPLATNLIDSAFGEENIITVPWDSIFEVRASNKYWEGSPFADTVLIQTKKEIVNKEEVGNNYITFDIKAKNWPITISWDSTLFHGQNDTLQYAGSWMTSWEYGQWWDGGMLPVYLGNRNEMLVSNDWHDLTGIDYEGMLNYSYQNNNDTIYTMWFNFQDSSAFTLSIKNNDKADEILFFPNLFENFFYIQGIEISKIASIRVYDLKGKEQNLQHEGTRFSIPKSALGIYIVEVGLKNQMRKHYYQLIKN